MSYIMKKKQGIGLFSIQVTQYDFKTLTIAYIGNY